jgi:uncharacterized protein
MNRIHGFRGDIQVPLSGRMRSRATCPAPVPTFPPSHVPTVPPGGAGLFPACRYSSRVLAASLLSPIIRNWALTASVCTIAACVFVAVLVILKYVRISLNIMRTTKPPLSRGPLDFERMTGEAVTFSAFDGSRLAGMIVRCPPHVQRRGMILFAHEFCSDLHSCARYCRPLNDAGYDIFAFDFRGHGQSACADDYTPRQWLTNHDLHDIRGAIALAYDWLEQRGLPREVGLFGISRGACAAILAAENDPGVRAIVADGAFSTDRVIEYFMKRWASIFATVRFLYENHPPAFWRFLRRVMMGFARREFRCSFPSVYKAIRRMRPRPMLFIHGEKDSYLPVEQSRVLYGLAPQPKHLWIAAGARHNQAVVMHPLAYSRLTTSFFHRYLGRQDVAVSTFAAADRERPATQPVGVASVGEAI